jgi:hypothetical protein
MAAHSNVDTCCLCCIEGLAMDLWNIPKHAACASACVRVNFSCFLSSALTQQDGLQTAVLAGRRALDCSSSNEHNCCQ